MHVIFTFSKRDGALAPTIHLGRTRRTTREDALASLTREPTYSPLDVPTDSEALAPGARTALAREHEGSVSSGAKPRAEGPEQSSDKSGGVSDSHSYDSRVGDSYSKDKIKRAGDSHS